MDEKESVTLPLHIDVCTTTKASPVLGLYSETTQTGWLWDNTLLTSMNVEQFNYNTYTGSFSFSLRDGTIFADWQSGSLGTKYINLDDHYNPVVSTGAFSICSDLRNLYSDFSRTSYFSTTNDDDQNIFTLPSKYVINSINVYGLTRNDSLVTHIADSFEYVSEFDDDTYKKEFTIINHKVVLNGNYIRQWGVSPESLDFDYIEEWGILLGEGNGSERDYFAKYFPILPDTIRAFVLDESGTVEEWDFVDNFNFSLGTDKDLVLNSDLGVISCGGYKPDNLVLNTDITDSATTIRFFTTKDINAYPLAGIIYIGDEAIAYTDKSHNKLLNCTRGYLSTSAAAHSIGDQIEFEQQGLPIPDTSSLYIYYESTIRIDFEVSDHALRTGLVDCRPSKNSTASKVVQISSKLRDLDSLLLESDKSSLGGSTYGPIYFGNDISKLTVTAKDSLGNSVDDIAITLKILDPVVGFLDGESTELTKYSNLDGKTFTYYNASVDLDTFSTKFSSLTFDGTSTVFEVDNLSSSISLEDIFIYQIFKQDPSMGSVGIKYIVDLYALSSRPNTDFKVVLNSVVTDIFNGGIAYFVSASGIIQTRPIVQAEGSTVYCSDGPLTITPQYVYLLTSEDLPWDADELNGIPVILYKWSDEATHPITGNDGAYIPILPESISGTTIIYDETFPEPEPDEISNNLGGYMIVAPILVGFRAEAIDPYSGDIIYSNTIYLLCKVPNYLVGVDYSGSLPVPKGFNFIIDEENVGNGIGGANFITINTQGGIFGLQIRFSS